MTFTKPQGGMQEFILCMAPDKTGKTTAALSVALAAIRHGSGRVVWLDTDNKADVLTYLYPELAESDRFELRTVLDWTQLREATTGKNDLRKLGPEDWLVGDVYGYSWTYAQEWTTEHMYGMEEWEYQAMVDEKRGQVAELKMTKKPATYTEKEQELVKFVNGHGFGGHDRDFWQAAGSMLRGWENKFVKASRCHKFLTCHEKTVIEDETKKGVTTKTFGEELASRFDEWGKRPDTHKATVSTVKTVVRLRKMRTGEVLMSVIDNGGREVDGADLGRVGENGEGGFAVDYLQAVAGWTL